MLASNLIAWTRNFLKMGGMENAFFFLLPFCFSAKSITSPIFILSGYIFRSSSDKPLSSSSLSHVGRRPVPDQVFSAFLGSRYFTCLCSLGLATPCIFMASRLMPASNFAVSQAGRFPIPVHVLKGLSGSRYMGSPLGRFSDFRGTSITFLPSEVFFSFLLDTISLALIINISRRNYNYAVKRK
ncbi:Uncharacterised protein [Klebsiella pneumoniae]|nr:Uncharacterised protein [Klebsiella pneumoniae]